MSNAVTEDIWDELETKTAKEEMLQTVIGVKSKGRGKNQHFPPSYFHYKNEILEITGGILRETQIVVPTAVRRKILEQMKGTWERPNQKGELEKFNLATDVERHQRNGY